jgi:hypothetical protein
LHSGRRAPLPALERQSVAAALVRCQRSRRRQRSTPSVGCGSGSVAHTAAPDASRAGAKTHRSGSGAGAGAHSLRGRTGGSRGEKGCHAGAGGGEGDDGGRQQQRRAGAARRRRRRRTSAAAAARGVPLWPTPSSAAPLRPSTRPHRLPLHIRCPAQLRHLPSSCSLEPAFIKPNGLSRERYQACLLRARLWPGVGRIQESNTNCARAGNTGAGLSKPPSLAGRLCRARLPQRGPPGPALHRRRTGVAGCRPIAARPLRTAARLCQRRVRGDPRSTSTGCSCDSSRRRRERLAARRHEAWRVWAADAAGPAEQARVLSLERPRGRSRCTLRSGCWRPADVAAQTQKAPWTHARLAALGARGRGSDGCVPGLPPLPLQPPAWRSTRPSWQPL